MKMAQPASNWADAVEAEEEGENAEEVILPDLPDRIESEVDENGIKTVVAYHKDIKTAERIKVTKKIKVVRKDERIKKAVLERRTWAKFGDSAATFEKDVKGKLPQGWLQKFSGVGFAQEGVTYHPDPVELDFTPKAKAEKKKKPTITDTKPVGVWRRRTPGEPGSAPAPGGNVSTLPSAAKTGAYVPPTLRGENGMRRTDLDNIRMQRDDSATLRVSNLSDDTREDDLQQLFRPFGPITRIYLAKDRNTSLSRGFAFVNFVRREDAAVAMEKLAGYGYDHLILQIEWAKPSP